MAGPPVGGTFSGTLQVTGVGTWWPVRNDADNMYKVDVWVGTRMGTTDGTWSFFSSIYPNGGWYDASIPALSSGTYTMWATIEYVCPQYYSGIERYDIMAVSFSVNPGIAVVYDRYWHLPAVEGIPGSGITTLFLGDDNRTYTDRSYATVACGTRAFRSYSDRGTFVDSRTKRSGNVRADSAQLRDELKFKRRREPKQSIPFTETMEVKSFRLNQPTNWLFTPSYRLWWDPYGNGTLEQTRWDARVSDWGQVSRSLKHWTGEFSVGNVSVSIIDTDSEIYGSLFGSSTPFDCRGKTFEVRSLTSDRPLTYVTQFRGQIEETECVDGQIIITGNDQTKSLPRRQFVYDYVNISTTIAGKNYGVVTKVLGTDVMFDDKGDIQWIERKKKGRSFLSAVFSGVCDGLFSGFMALVTGNPGAALAASGVGFARGFLNNGPSADKMIGGYYKVSDYDAVPDDLVKSGMKLKFYSGSISGVAQNSFGSLFNTTERVVSGGTYLYGIYGTVSLNDTSGIRVGDNIYVRKPIFFGGCPSDVFRAILCGSNIDYPFNAYDSVITQPDSAGGFSIQYLTRSDFATNFNSECGIFDQIYLSKIISTDENTTPLEELKKIASDLQVSFFIDSSDKFAVRSYAPKFVLLPNTLATYNMSVIRKGFSFKRGNEDAVAGVRYFYNYLGRGLGAFADGYGNMIEIPAKNPLAGNSDWLEIPSEWVRRSDDAYCIAYRANKMRERGIDRVTVPTSLYGDNLEIADAVVITHDTGSLTTRPFEIENVTKNFTRSEVQFEAVDIRRTWGQGNAVWGSTFSTIGSLSISGYSSVGIDGPVVAIGSLNGTLYPNVQWADAAWVTSAKPKGQINRIFAFGSLPNTGVEFVLVRLAYPYAGDTMSRLYLEKRGLFSTLIKTYYTGELIYDIGPAQFDKNGNVIFDNFIDRVVQIGTTRNINPNFGTAFRFF